MILSGAVAVVVLALALWATGTLPEMPQWLRLTLDRLPQSSLTAATALGQSQGLPVYDTYYPSPGTCNSGDALCFPYTRIGVFSIRNQSPNTSTGMTKYRDLQLALGSLGTAVTLTSLNASTVEWSCQQHQNVGTQYATGVYQCGCSGGNCCSWLSPCCCPVYCTSYAWSYTDYPMSTEGVVTDPNGVVVAGGSGQRYGTASVALGGVAGTYDAGSTVNYTLSCTNGGITPITIPVTMGTTITTATIAANPTTVRGGLDQTTLTITAGQAVADSCKLYGPGGAVVKSYSGTSVSDVVQVGPLSWDTDTKTYQIKCLGPEGFNKTASAVITVSKPPVLSITANNTPTTVTIPAGTSADIRWTSSNQHPNSCSVTYTATGGTCTAAAKSIATKGAYAWKAFTVGTDTYLAVANAYSGVTYSVNSSIYKWVPSLQCFGKDGSSACGTSYQDIATQGAAMWDSFVVGSDTYLAVANSRNDSTRNVNSVIYKWLSAQACFGADTTCGTAYQSIPTSGAVDLQPITVGSTLYLAAANYRDDTTYATSSTLYRWMSSGTNCPSGGGFGNGTACGSVLQSIATKGAYRMEAFVVEGESYLAVSNAYDGSGYNLPSHIYKYTATGTNCPSGGGFGNGNTHTCGTPIQTINTSGAYGFKFFMVGSTPYLAVANSYDGTTFQINSKIYKWMSGSKCFGSGTTCSAAFQVLATKGATQLQTFNVGPDVYMLAANAYDGLSYNLSSNLYRWIPGSQCFGNDTTCGVALQAIPTSGAAWWEPATISNKVYLATANYFNGTTRTINSSVMLWSPNGCGDTELGTPTTWTGDQSPAGGYQTGIFSGARLYTLTCKWLDTTTASSTTVMVSTLPELILSANGSTTNPVYITPDTSALVQWSAKNVQNGSCTVVNTRDATVWTADNNTAGYSSPVLAEGEEVTYTLACTGLGGEATNKQMRVVAAVEVPVAANDLSITASRVVKGGRPTIGWTAQNLKPGLTCNITPILQGGSSASTWNGSGTTWTSPAGGALGPIITVATTFMLKCVNAAGDSAQVTAIANLIPGFKEI